MSVHFYNDRINAGECFLQRGRSELQPVRGADQISVDLRLLTARRTDVIGDRVRAINRLRATLLEYFPALERAFDYSKRRR